MSPRCQKPSRGGTGWSSSDDRDIDRGCHHRATVYPICMIRLRVMATMLEQIRQRMAGNRPAAPFPHLAGIAITDVEEGRAVPCTLADSAMGIAYASTLEEGQSFATLELKINFLRPVRSGMLVAEGVVVHLHDPSRRTGRRTLGITGRALGRRGPCIQSGGLLA